MGSLTDSVLGRTSVGVSPRRAFFQINHPKKLDDIFSPKTFEKQYAQDKAVDKNIDEWIGRTESMGRIAFYQR